LTPAPKSPDARHPWNLRRCRMSDTPYPSRGVRRRRPIAPNTRVRRTSDAGKRWEPAQVPAGAHPALAEAHGWRADIEERILGASAIVDVALRKGERSVACEIGVTTNARARTPEHPEVSGAGFERVVVVSSEKRTLNQIRCWPSRHYPSSRQARWTTSCPRSCSIPRRRRNRVAVN